MIMPQFIRMISPDQGGNVLPREHAQYYGPYFSSGVTTSHEK